jgi:MFS family permease
MSNNNNTEENDYPPAGYSWYVVGVLTLAYVFSFIDRQILSLLVGPIRKDLEISETQISLLMGATFAVFYTLFGIPLGRLADTRSRRMLIGLGIAFWSVMTAGCGLTKSFWQLALMRVGVGVGEASLSPSAYSMIADYFRPERRATAMSVYSMGIYLGSGLAFILLGLVLRFTSGQESFLVPLVGAVRSWQLVFFVVGLPGLLVALLMLTVREPIRRGARRIAEGTTVAGASSLAEVWAYVRDNRATFLYLNLGMAMVTLNAYAGSSWISQLFIRRYGLSLADTGVLFGCLVGTSSTLGVVTGGWFADWLSQRGMTDAPVRVAWISVVAWLPFGLLFPLMPTVTSMATVLLPALFFGSVPFGVAPAALQQMMPNAMRAQATSIYLFVINLIGMGLGPTAVALLTEKVFDDEKAVHLSLLTVGAVAHLSATVLLWLALKHYRQSLEYLKEWSKAHA